MKWLRVFATKELMLENSILQQRLDKLESQYGDPYMRGFSHGIEMAYKFAPKIDEKIANSIKSQAIQETLDRMNGNHKKTH